MPPARRSIATIALALMLLPVFASNPFAGETVIGKIRVARPWARATAGTATVGAAYMRLDNMGAAADRLIEASSPVAAKTEMHTHIIEGDVMRMRAVDGVDLPPGETVEFQPGGLHVMLIGLTAALETGKNFPLTLNFAEAGTITVEVEVLQPGAIEPGREQAREKSSGDHPGRDHGHQGQEHTPADEGMKRAQ
ncbi:MAG: copper chaperone PCu(A)C [Hyphomicrobium sp.]|jgi:copper(I)-binding protein